MVGMLSLRMKGPRRATMYRTFYAPAACVADSLPEAGLRILVLLHLFPLLPLYYLTEF